MDIATDEICDRQCHQCTNSAAQLCRRWVPQFQARPEYVRELESDNKRLANRADECWKLAWDCMSYIVAARNEKAISKTAYAKLHERAVRLGLQEVDSE